MKMHPLTEKEKEVIEFLHGFDCQECGLAPAKNILTASNDKEGLVSMLCEYCTVITVLGFISFAKNNPEHKARFEHEILRRMEKTNGN